MPSCASATSGPTCTRSCPTWETTRRRDEPSGARRRLTVDGPFFWVIVALLISVLVSVAALRKRVEEIRHRLNAVAEHLNVSSATKVPPEVFGLIQAGRKI